MSTPPPTPRGWDPLRWAHVWSESCAELAAIAEEVRLSEPGVLARELQDLALEATDPELFSLVEFARAPLVIPDGPSPRQTQPRLVGRSERHLLDLSHLSVPERVHQSIGEHAATAAPGHEVVGRLICHNRVARRYERLQNLSSAPGRFSTRATWRPGPGEYQLVVHSHPHGSSASPSNHDFAYAKKRSWPVIGIWHSDGDRLCVFRLFDDAFLRIPIEIIRERKPDAALGPRRRAATITASAHRR